MMLIGVKISYQVAEDTVTSASIFIKVILISALSMHR